MATRKKKSKKVKSPKQTLAEFEAAGGKITVIPFTPPAFILEMAAKRRKDEGRGRLVR